MARPALPDGSGRGGFLPTGDDEGERALHRQAGTGGPVVAIDQAEVSQMAERLLPIARAEAADHDPAVIIKNRKRAIGATVTRVGDIGAATARVELAAQGANDVAQGHVTPRSWIDREGGSERLAHRRGGEGRFLWPTNGPSRVDRRRVAPPRTGHGRVARALKAAECRFETLDHRSRRPSGAWEGVRNRS